MLVCLPLDLSFCLPAQIAQRSYQCPADLPQLTTLLLRDIIPYANRAAQRRRRRLDANGRPDPSGKLDTSYNSYLVVGRGSLEAVAIDNPEYNPSRSGPQQLFVTSLEKQYSPGPKFIEIQRFHWIFLARSQAGWSLSAIYSRVGSNGSDPLLLPPTDSLSTPFGEAIATWLRDCNAGKIRP
jgi:hypothetical protein